MISIRSELPHIKADGWLRASSQLAPLKKSYCRSTRVLESPSEVLKSYTDNTKICIIFQSTKFIFNYFQLFPYLNNP